MLYCVFSRMISWSRVLHSFYLLRWSAVSETAIIKLDLQFKKNKKKTGLRAFCSHTAFKWSYRRIYNCFGGAQTVQHSNSLFLQQIIALTWSISLSGRTHKGAMEQNGNKEAFRPNWHYGSSSKHESTSEHLFSTSVHWTEVFTKFVFIVCTPLKLLIAQRK